MQKYKLFSYFVECFCHLYNEIIVAWWLTLIKVNVIKKFTLLYCMFLYDIIYKSNISFMWYSF